MLSPELKSEASILELELQSLKQQGDNLKTQANNSTKSDLIKSAKNFESYMMSFMYRQMHKSIPKSGFMGNPFAQNIYMGLYLDEVTKKAELSPNSLAAKIIKQYESNYANSSGELNDILSTASDPTQSVAGHVSGQLNKTDHHLTSLNILKDFENMLTKHSKDITSGYGLRNHPILNVEKPHHGIDFGFSEGSDVNPATAGKVKFAGTKPGYGNVVIVDHSHGLSSLYAHLSKISVNEGENVDKKTVLGTVGSTGRSTGPHLHFEIRKDDQPLDPMRFVSSHTEEKVVK